MITIPWRSLKYANSLYARIATIIFIALLAALYQTSFPAWVKWIVFFPLKFLYNNGLSRAHLTTDQATLLALFAGVPLTAIYWLWLFGISPESKDS